MKPVYEANKDDLDIAFAYAEAMMNRTPWQMWDLVTGTPVAGADTLDAFELDHPACWTCHVYGVSCKT